MADWKQITARIRRARTGKDPIGQLSSLFEKTRDAMVAFELARAFETSGQNSDAAKWYVAAAERFRRADWKSKAQEAAVRLGADISAAASAEAPAATELGAISEVQTEAVESSAAEPSSYPGNAEPAEGADETPSTRDAGPSDASERRGRRRGRRGGRNRRKGQAPEASAKAASAGPAVRAQREEPPPVETAEAPVESSRPTHRRSVPALPVEPVPDYAPATVRGRFGDPGLSSRLSALEMQLRRLLSCPPVKLGEGDHAPAGPGVLLLTDSDLTSYYYVEACQTLRIAVGNLLRGSARGRGAESIKPRLAEHLGIPESRVAKYLTDHCVVRWLQLDDGASHFAHFAVAVLRPTLNE